jgi:glutaminase
MYDGAGAWMSAIGLPAKSGVSGGILAVLPGRLAVACYSPLLDGHGNSVRGAAVCRELSERFGLHLVRPGERLASPIRSAVDLTAVSSKRVRTLEEREALAELGSHALVVELQGDLGFDAVEQLNRIVRRAGRLEALVLDLGRVARIDPGGHVLLDELVASLREAGVDVRLAGLGAVAERASLAASLGGASSTDLAVEACETTLLERAGVGTSMTETELAEHPFLTRLTEVDRAAVVRHLVPRRYAAGATIARQGARADDLFVVTRGLVNVVDDSEPESRRRAATVPAGGVFGEIGIALGGRRTATVLADTDVDVHVLDRHGLAALRQGHPRAYAAVLEELLAGLALTATRLDREVAALTAG